MYFYELGPVFSAGTIPLNIWTHIAFVHDGAKANLYINGNFVYAQYHGNPTGTGTCCFGWCNPTLDPYPIQAYLDDFYIYKRPLSLGEVNRIMNEYN